MALLTTTIALAHAPSAERSSSAPRWTLPAVGAPRPVAYPGLRNVVRAGEKLVSGSAPDGEEGFASLKRLGIRTIISVDGARPDAAAGRRYGIRTVHLPFGYDGCPTPRAIEIIRAVRDLPGPIYLHCHHGKHRSPAAAALVQIALDGLSNADAVAFMKRSGAAPEYVGLYSDVRSFRRPSRAVIDRASRRFPSAATVPALTEAMVQLDARFTALNQSRAAGWGVPREHPDLAPAHEALQLKELYRELRRTRGSRLGDQAFKARLRDGEARASELEAALRVGDTARADRTLDRLAVGCTSCHAQYRNVPRVR